MKKLESFAFHALVFIAVFGLLALVVVNILGCGKNPDPVGIGKGSDCVIRCRDTGRDVKVFWQYFDVNGTVSSRCECL